MTKDIQKIDATMVAQTGGGLTDQEAQRAVAEVQASMILAKKFPRNQIESIERIKTTCQRPTLAENALYQYSRGGTDVSGPSIRLAEAIAQNWGNLQFGIRELSQSNGESTVEAFAWDIETNTRQVKVFQVPHVRYTRKNGNVDLKDPRDIYELIANNGARRMRACILGVIPGDVVDIAVAECEKTLKSDADTSPEAMNKMLMKFREFGVDRKMIEQRIGRKLESITPAQVVSLRKTFTSLKDGMSSPADWFHVEQEQGENLTSQIKPKEQKSDQMAEVKQEQQPEKVADKKEAPDQEQDSEQAELLNGEMSPEEYREKIVENLATFCGGKADQMDALLSELAGQKVKVSDIPMFSQDALPMVLDAVEKHMSGGEA